MPVALLQVPLSRFPADSPLRGALGGHIGNSEGFVVGERGTHAGRVSYMVASEAV